MLTQLRTQFFQKLKFIASIRDKPHIVLDNIGYLVQLYQLFVIDCYVASLGDSRPFDGAFPRVFHGVKPFFSQSSTNGTNDALRVVPACATDVNIFLLLSCSRKH